MTSIWNMTVYVTMETDNNNINNTKKVFLYFKYNRDETLIELSKFNSNFLQQSYSIQQIIHKILKNWRGFVIQRLYNYEVSSVLK